MGDSGPLDILEFIHHRALVVGGIQVVVDLVQKLGGQGSARLVEVVGLAFEFGKEGLAEESGAEAL